MRLHENEAGDAEPVYAAGEVDEYVADLQATIGHLRSDLQQRDLELSALRRAARDGAAATETPEATVGRAFIAAHRAAAALIRQTSEDAAIIDLPRSDTPETTMPSDDTYFDALRRRVRASEEHADRG